MRLRRRPRRSRRRRSSLRNCHRRQRPFSAPAALRILCRNRPIDGQSLPRLRSHVGPFGVRQLCYRFYGEIPNAKPKSRTTLVGLAPHSSGQLLDSCVFRAPFNLTPPHPAPNPLSPNAGIPGAPPPPARGRPAGVIRKPRSSQRNPSPQAESGNTRHGAQSLSAQDP